MLLFGTAIIKVRGDKNMKNIEIKLDVEPKDNYEKAKKDLIQAKLSFEKLTEQQKEWLVVEVLGLDFV